MRKRRPLQLPLRLPPPIPPPLQLELVAAEWPAIDVLIEEGRRRYEARAKK